MKKLLTTIFAVAAFSLVGGATQADAAVIRPSDIAPCEVGGDDATVSGFNYNTWHVSTSCPGNDFERFDILGNTLYVNAKIDPENYLNNKAHQVLLGYHPDNRKTFEDIDSASWLGNEYTSFQIPIFFKLTGEEESWLFTTLRPVSYDDNGVEKNDIFSLNLEDNWVTSNTATGVDGANVAYKGVKLYDILGAFHSYEILGFGVGSTDINNAEVTSITWAGETYTFAENDVLSLSGFSNQTMRVGDSATINGSLDLADFGGTKIEGHHLFTLTSGDESGIEVTSVGISTLLGTEIPFDFECDGPCGEDNSLKIGDNASIALDVTIKALKEGTYTFNYKAIVGDVTKVDENFTVTVNRRQTSSSSGSRPVSQTPAPTPSAPIDSNTGLPTTPSTPEEKATEIQKFGDALLPGARGEGVAMLQAFLNTNGFGPLAVDGISGPMTRAALDRYMNSININTSTTVEFSTNTNIRIGDRNRDVSSLQAILNQKGFNVGVADGIFGPRTMAQVRAFQAANGLVVDGIVGPATRAALNK